ncbi:MAG TPA: protein kinase [Polyangia bacterium]|nr:protein kinase [Polyangia bacterium]
MMDYGNPLKSSVFRSVDHPSFSELEAKSMLGTRIGAYTIKRRLGAGGMGEVFLAEHRHLARSAAIKILLPEISHNPDLVARLFTEARATSSLRHPSIVEIFDCDVLPDGRAYIVMEYLKGQTLATTLDHSPAFRHDLRRMAAIVCRVADGLASAHASGIVHRDLKPDNVFLARGPEFPNAIDVKVLDFGIAKLLDQKSGHAKTRTGNVLGTPIYMSPEQCRGAGVVDHRADVYSLGCMMFEMLCGLPPFVREGVGELLVAHLSELPPTVSSLRPEVPPPLGELVSRMLIKDPGQRIGSMREIVNTLETWLGTSSLAVAALVTPPADFPSAEPPNDLVPASAIATAVAAGSPASEALIPDVSASAGGTQLLPQNDTTFSRSVSVLEGRWTPRPTRSGRWVVALGVATAAVAAWLVLRAGILGPRLLSPSVPKDFPRSATASAPVETAPESERLPATPPAIAPSDKPSTTKPAPPLIPAEQTARSAANARPAENRNEGNARNVRRHLDSQGKHRKIPAEFKVGPPSGDPYRAVGD